MGAVWLRPQEGPDSGDVPDPGLPSQTAGWSQAPGEGEERENHNIGIEECLVRRISLFHVYFNIAKNDDTTETNNSG